MIELKIIIIFSFINSASTHSTSESPRMFTISLLMVSQGTPLLVSIKVILVFPYSWDYWEILKISTWHMYFNDWCHIGWDTYFSQKNQRSFIWKILFMQFTIKPYNNISKEFMQFSSSFEKKNPCIAIKPYHINVKQKIQAVYILGAALSQFSPDKTRTVFKKKWSGYWNSIPGYFQARVQARG